MRSHVLARLARHRVRNHLRNGTVLNFSAAAFCHRALPCEVFGVWRLGFGVWGMGFEVGGLEFWVWGLEFGVWALGFGFWGSGFGVRVLGSGVWGLGSGIWGLGFGVCGSELHRPRRSQPPVRGREAGEEWGRERETIGCARSCRRGAAPGRTGHDQAASVGVHARRPCW